MAATLYKQARFRLSGDRALLVEYGDGIDLVINEKVRAMTTLLKRNLPAGVEAVVPAYRSLSILYDPLATTPARLAAILHDLEADFCAAEIAKAKVVPIPVCYGGEFGPDLADVAAAHGLTPEEVIAIHSGAIYTIYMLGFSPGFAYMGEVPASIATPPCAATASPLPPSARSGTRASPRHHRLR